MARSLIIVCIALAALVHFHPVSSTGLDVIKTNVDDTVKTAKTITGNIKDATASTAGALDDHLGTTELITLLTGLPSDITALVTSLSVAIPDSLKNAFTIIQNAVAEIKNAVSGAIPLLNSIVQLLGDILQQVIELVNAVLGLVLDLLGTLNSQLNKAVTGLLVSASK